MAPWSATAYAWHRFQPIDRLEAYVASFRRGKVATIEIAFARPVSSVEGVEEELLEAAYSLVSEDPFDGDALEQIQGFMRRCGWMEPETVRISRDLIARDYGGKTRYVDRILIDGLFLQPFAFIRRDACDYVIDTYGRRLPKHYIADRVRALPVVLNAMGPMPNVGEPWPGRDVTDGIALIRYLRQQARPWYKEIRSVDVSNYDGHDRKRGHLLLRTRQGYAIDWGRAVGQEAGIDQPAADKILALDLSYRNQGYVLGSPQGTLIVSRPLITTDRVRVAEEEDADADRGGATTDARAGNALASRDGR